MNKKIFLTLLMLIFIPCLFIFSGCKDKKIYFTVDTLPTGVDSAYVSDISGAQGGDSKGSYVMKGEESKISVIIKDGYTLGPLKVSVCGKEVALSPASTEDISHEYVGTFTADEDFKVSFKNAPVVITSVINFELDENYTEPNESEQIFVKFPKATEYGLAKTEYNLKEFVALVNNHLAISNVKATENFEMYVYSKNYSLKVQETPVYIKGDSRSFNEFFAKDGAYGFYFGEKFYKTSTIVIATQAATSNIAVTMTNNNYHNYLLSDNNIFTVKVNGGQMTEDGEYNYFDASVFDSANSVNINFEFSGLSNEQFESLSGRVEFSIYEGEKLNFTVDAASKTLTVTLNRPYTYYLKSDGFLRESYYHQYAYRYHFETNLEEVLTELGVDTSALFLE